MSSGSAPTIVLASQAAIDEGVVQAARLEQLAAAAQLRVRRVRGTQADLMVSKAGVTLPFLFWRDASARVPGNNSSASGTVAAARKLAGSSRQGYVLLPNELLGNPAVLDAVSSLSCEADCLSFVWMPMGACFTQHALALAQALIPAEAQEAAWRQQQAQAVASSEAVNQVLLGLPLPPDGDALHHANMLRMLGSISDISQRRAEEIAAHTDLDSCWAAAIAAFFQRGGRQPEAPSGLALLAQLHSL